MVESTLKTAKNDFENNITHVQNCAYEQSEEIAKVYKEVIDALKRDLGDDDSDLRRLVSDAQILLISPAAALQVSQKQENGTMLTIF